jgi:hypothetical protein
MIIQGQVGTTPQSLTTGVTPSVRQGQLGDTVVSQLHGRFYEPAYRGNLFIANIPAYTLVVNNATSANTTTGAVPIVGVWNPTTSGVNLVLQQAGLQIVNTAASSNASGAFVWAYATNQSALTSTTSGIASRTLTSSSQGKVYGGGTATLTGLTGSLTVLEGADLAGGLAIATTSIATSTVVPNFAYVQNFDGSVIVPPGGVWVLMNTVNNSTTAVTSHLVWEEVPL